ncbi:DUF4255 domain-containing protein [Thalassoporum mexicanum]|uniref:DUF4255 domain-containing protein n=1 Tax=Thalassoporum mexicanum TaxID=3457544 RepID=UPI001CEC8F43|nr:DUF4255 domain-containing protein [Pseudanabaena sp. PCC 7367]
MQVALQNYIKEVEQTLDSSQDIVILDNIAMAEELGGNRSNMNERIVMSLVNLEEETTLKNSPNYHMVNGRTIYQNPPISLNLFVLFSVLHSEQYDTALKRLARVIEFFQWQREFSFTTTPGPNGLSKDVRVLPDLYTLTFDQLNHLWGALGGKQVPFVMYRTRMVMLDAQKLQSEGEPIRERVLK